MKYFGLIFYLCSPLLQTANSAPRFKQFDLHRICNIFLRPASGPTEGEKYKTFPMDEDFWLHDTIHGSKYFVSRAEAMKAQIVFDRAVGIWKYAQSGVPVPDGKFNFVMDGAGGLYIYPVDFPASSPGGPLWGRTPHSAFFEGASLAAAGEVDFGASLMYAANTATGHYQKYFAADQRLSETNAMQFLKEVFEQNPNHPPIHMHLWGSGIVFNASAELTNQYWSANKKGWMIEKVLHDKLYDVPPVPVPTRPAAH